MARTINNLPNELLTYVFSFIDGPSTFTQRLHGDTAKVLDIIADDENKEGGPVASPTFHPLAAAGTNIADSPPAESQCQQAADVSSGDASTSKASGSNLSSSDLKNASLVCSLWRQLLLPSLFRHVVWKVQSITRPPPDHKDALSEVPQLDFLRFLDREGISSQVDGLTIVIDYPEANIGEDLTHHNSFGILPSHCPASSTEADGGEQEQSSSSRPDRWLTDNNWLWHTVFDQLDLLRITLIGSPGTLAALLGRPVDLSGAQVYSQRFHILSLSRPSRPSPSEKGSPRASNQALPSSQLPTSDVNTRSYPCDLFSIRNWSSFLVNEGSFVKVFSTYDFFNHAPPSLLPALLDASDPSMKPLLTTLHTFSYIAIFPLTSHISGVLLPNIPPVEHFFVQLTPRSVNLDEDEYRQPAMEFCDLLLERNTNYANIFTSIFAPEPLGIWRRLRIFQSGDVNDTEAWEQAVRYVVFSAGKKWKIAGKGFFVKRSGDDDDDQEMPQVY